MDYSTPTTGAYVSKGDKLLHQATVTGKVSFVDVIEAKLHVRDGQETYIVLRDPCGREWTAYGDLWRGDDYSDFTVIARTGGRGVLAKGMKQ